MTEDQKDRLSSLLDRWFTVQGRLKHAEQIGQLAVLPAINELRYAGRLLVAALANQEPTETNGLPALGDAITIANQYITNAEHDISDAIMYFYQKKADDLAFRYGSKTICDRFPDYQEFLDDLAAGRKLVVNSREKMEGRESAYEKLTEITERLLDNYSLLTSSEVLFGAEVRHYNSRILLWKILFGVAVAFWAGVSIHAYAF